MAKVLLNMNRHIRRQYANGKLLSELLPSTSNAVEANTLKYPMTRNCK